MQNRKSSLFSIFFTFSLDNLSATIVFPIFAPLFLNPEQGLIPMHVPMNIRALLLGFFLGAFPFAQFLFSPIVGEFADRYGRKKGLLITTVLAFVGYFLSAFGIARHYLSVLFLGRLILGLSAANLSICLAAIADLSRSQRQKTKYISYGSALAGLTFVLGPFFGGKLSDSALSPYFNPAFPMWIGSGFALLNLLFIIFAFRETREEEIALPFDFMEGITDIHKAFKLVKLRELYIIYFLFLFSFNMIFQFIPAFMVQDFSLSNARIGDITALMGLCWIIGTTLINRVCHLLLSPRGILIGVLSLYTALCFVVPFITSFIWLIVFLGLLVALAGVIWPVCTACISSSAQKNFRGKILGISQSLQSLAMMLAPFIGGAFLVAHSGIPFYIAAIVAFLAAWTIVRSKQKFEEKKEF